MTKFVIQLLRKRSNARRLLALFMVPIFASIPAQAQSDSIVVLSERVGRSMDHRERLYFDISFACPDSEAVFLVRSPEDSGKMFLRSSHRDRPASRLDSAGLILLRNRVEYIEARKAQIAPEQWQEVREVEEGIAVWIELDPSGQVSGELLFADVHGVALRDSAIRPVPLGSIRSVRTSREFGVGAATMTKVGLAVGVVSFGLSGVLGGDTEAGVGLFATAFFSGVGTVVGLLYDIFAAAAGDRIIYERGDTLEQIGDLQQESRYPLGTPELKRLLGELGEEQGRQP